MTGTSRFGASARKKLKKKTKTEIISEENEVTGLSIEALDYPRRWTRKKWKQRSKMECSP